MNYSIGIVTYHARFQKYFIPLIEKLTKVFPDKEILCVVNGHPDKTLQINYLNSVTIFLSKFSNIRYLTYDTNQSLSKCWNQLTILSRTKRILILNDDTQVTELFRQEFEKKVVQKDFSIINGSWSHFLISKEIIKKVGWFDERLLGIGYEDVDFGMRMAMVDMQISNTECLGIDNYVAEQENPGWKQISKKLTGNKYSGVNFEFFKKKWITSEFNTEIKNGFKFTMKWNNSTIKFCPIDNGVVPNFYSFNCLDRKEEIKTRPHTVYIQNHLKIGVQKIFFTCKQILKKIYRLIVS